VRWGKENGKASWSLVVIHKKNEEGGEQGEEQESEESDHCREPEGDEPGDGGPEEDDPGNGEPAECSIPCPSGGWSPVAASIIAEVETDKEMTSKLNMILRSKNKRARISD